MDTTERRISRPRASWAIRWPGTSRRPATASPSTTARRRRPRAGSAQHGGRSAPTPAAAAAGAELVLMCVGNDDDVRAVALGADGALAGDARGRDPRRSHDGVRAGRARDPRGGDGEGRRLPRRAGLGRPGRRRERQAHDHGRRRRRRRSRAPSRVLAHYARAVTLMGGPGSGQLTKMVNQICIAGLVAGARRGHQLRREGRARRRARARRDRQGRRAVVADGQPRQDDGRRQVRLRLRRRLDAQGPRRSASPRRARNGAALPVTALVDQFYARVQAQGGGRWDTSSLHPRAARRSG